MSRYRATAVSTRTPITIPLILAGVAAVIIFDTNGNHFPMWGLFVCLGIFIVGTAIAGGIKGSDDAVLVERD